MITQPEVNSMPLIALRGLVVFPYMQIHFDVGRSRSIQAVYDAMAGDRLVFLTAQQDMREEEPTGERLQTTGCIAKIRQILKLPGEGVRVMADGLQRGKLCALEQDDPFFRAKILPLEDIAVSASVLEEKGLLRAVKSSFEKYARVNTKLPPDIVLEVTKEAQLGKLCDYIAGNVPFSEEVKQTLLEQREIKSRGESLVAALQSEAELLALEIRIEQRVRETMDENQRDYYLREQMRVIAEEL